MKPEEVPDDRHDRNRDPAWIATEYNMAKDTPMWMTRVGKKHAFERLRTSHLFNILRAAHEGRVCVHAVKIRRLLEELRRRKFDPSYFAKLFGEHRVVLRAAYRGKSAISDLPESYSTYYMDRAIWMPAPPE